MNKRTKGASMQGAIDFHYEKSRFFRVIHVDGAWGGLTVRGDIHMALFSQYPPLPEVVQHTIESGRVGQEVSRTAKHGLIRELEVEALIGLETAIALRDWLTDKIEKAQQARQQQE